MGFCLQAPVGSIHVPFETAMFDYGEVQADLLALEVEHGDARNSLLVQVSMTENAGDRSTGTVLASSLLSITEVIR
jgi:hypothetical protein